MSLLNKSCPAMDCELTDRECDMPYLQICSKYEHFLFDPEVSGLSNHTSNNIGCCYSTHQPFVRSDGRVFVDDRAVEVAVNTARMLAAFRFGYSVVVYGVFYKTGSCNHETP